MRFALALALLVGCEANRTFADPSAAPSVEVPFKPWQGTASISGAIAQPKITYAGTQTLDLFLPDHGTKPYPLVLRIGGSFDTSTAHMVETGPAAQRIVAAGYALAAVSFRHEFPAGPRDVKAAVRFLRANAARFDLDPKHFAAWGDDSGGWFAVMLGVTGDQATAFDDPSLGNAGTSSAVQAVVDWAGPVDFTTIDGQSAQNPPLPCKDTFRRHAGAGTPESTWLCGDRGSSLLEPQCAAAVNDANLVRYVATAKTLPPFTIAHGADDCDLPWGQSVELTLALQKREATVTYKKSSRAVHGDPQIEAEETDHALEMLATALK